MQTEPPQLCVLPEVLAPWSEDTFAGYKLRLQCNENIAIVMITVLHPQSNDNLYYTLVETSAAKGKKNKAKLDADFKANKTILKAIK